MHIVDWLSALESSRYDSVVGIRVAKLADANGFGTYLTAIAPNESVAAHYHRDNDEHYHIVKGFGEITLTDIRSGSTMVIAVQAQSSFVVPRNTGHVLKTLVRNL